MRNLLFAFVLTCSMPHLSLGHDFEDVERHLGLAVHEGMLTLQQANVMFEALKANADQNPMANAAYGDMQHRLANVKKMIKQAVEAGKLDEQEAREKMQIVQRRARLAKARMEIRKAIESGKLTPQEAREKIEWMRDQLGQLSQEDTRPHDQREQRDREQRQWKQRDRDQPADRRKRPDNRRRAGRPPIDRQRNRERSAPEDRGADAGVPAHLKRLGVDPAAVQRVRQTLEDAGFEDDQLRPAMGSILRMVGQLRSEEHSPRFDRIDEFLTEEVGLERNQVQLLQRLAKRLAKAEPADHREHDRRKKKRDHDHDHDKKSDHHEDQHEDHQTRDQTPAQPFVIFARHEPFHEND